MNSKTTFQNLVNYCQNTQTLNSINSLLSWDQETYMPELAISHRSNQVSLVAKLVHQRWTSGEFKKLLAECIDLDSGKVILENLTFVELKQIELIYDDWKKKLSLSDDFVENFSRTVSEATYIWQKSKEENNYILFKPHLEKLIFLAQKKAKLVNSKKPAYDVLLDEYEPGMNSKRLLSILEPLKHECIAMLAKIKKSKLNFNSINHKFDSSKQLQLSNEILKIMNFDFKQGRLDTSSHPFTVDMHSSDVRVTTRLNETNLFESITSTIHEGGHGLYEQGLSKEFFGMPLGQSISLGIHESQSRFWENHIGKSLTFWKSLYPRLVSFFPNELVNQDEYSLWKNLNKVEPGLIRVDADEISYCLHIIIRFECEQKLFAGSLSVDELPNYWNQLHKDYLGLQSNTYSEGVLQDIHWSTGAFGYFPTYVLGSIIAAQLDEKIQSEINTFDEHLNSLNLKPINNWLQLNIFKHGRIYNSDTLVEKITGKKIDVFSFIKYLKKKYSNIYEVSL